jgi:hypothetical protein
MLLCCFPVKPQINNNLGIITFMIVDINGQRGRGLGGRGVPPPPKNFYWFIPHPRPHGAIGDLSPPPRFLAPPHLKFDPTAMYDN